MCRVVFACSGYGKQLFFADVAGREYLLYGEAAFCYRACFIHDYGFYIFECFDRKSAFEQYAELGCSSDAGEECERHADNECARAAYTEERDRCRDPFAPAACNDRRDYSREDCEAYDYRCVDFCESGDESVHLRFACSSIFD